MTDEPLSERRSPELVRTAARFAGILALIADTITIGSVVASLVQDEQPAPVTLSTYLTTALIFTFAIALLMFSRSDDASVDLIAAGFSVIYAILGALLLSVGALARGTNRPSVALFGIACAVLAAIVANLANAPVKPLSVPFMASSTFLASTATISIVQNSSNPSSTLTAKLSFFIVSSAIVFALLYWGEAGQTWEGQ